MDYKICLIYAEGDICQCTPPKKLIFSNDIASQIIKTKRGVNVRLGYDSEDEVLFLVFKKPRKFTIYLEFFDKLEIQWPASFEKEIMDLLNKMVESMKVEIGEEDEVIQLQTFVTFDYENRRWQSSFAINKTVRNLIF